MNSNNDFRQGEDSHLDIEQYIEAQMSGTIIRKRDTLLPGLLVLAVGIGCLMLLRSEVMADVLMATCLTVGLIATVVGLILMAMNLSGALTHYVYKPTGSRMRNKMVYVNHDDYNDVVSAIVQHDMQSLASFRSVVGSNCALRLIVSRDGVCTLVQAGRCDSGRFEPETDVTCLTEKDSEVIKMLYK